MAVSSKNQKALTSTSITLSERRRQRIDEMRRLGVNPYPSEAFAPSHDVEELVLFAKSLIEKQTVVRTAGRIMAYRKVGKAIFMDLFDQGFTLQIYLSKSNLPKLDWTSAELLDIGDFVGVDGDLFTTRKGQDSLKVTTLTVLCKSIEPLPVGKKTADGVSHQALADRGRLLRERHVNMLVDDKLRERLIVRCKIIREVRSYFEEHGFVEIETPVLGRAYGGAAAEPFTTYCRALKTKMYLRVSPECYLKRALCGGLNKVFEVGKNFRNEGIDHSHNPEFTAVEWYEAWSDYREHMVRFENLVARLAIAVTGSTVVRYKGEVIDFAPPWPRRRVIDLVAENLNLSVDSVTKAALENAWEKFELPGARPTSWGELMMGVFEERIESTLKGPVFIIDHPTEISPLTKSHRSDERLVERFEPFVLGMEIGNSYSELNDPIEQRKRLSKQDVVRDEPYGLDEDFLKAIDHGMPQAAGTGIGLDRVIMILTDSNRLSDVILFPAL